MRCFALLLLTSAVYLCSVDALGEMACKDFMGSLTKRQLGGIASCSKAMKFKNAKEKAAKMNCILKCVMQKEGILNADNQFDDAALNKFLETEIPSNLMDKAKPMLTKCVGEAASVDPNEEMCKTYDPLIKCMLTFISDICK